MQARLQRLRLKCRRKHGDIEVLGRALLVKHALPLCNYGFGGEVWERGKVCVVQRVAKGPSVRGQGMRLGLCSGDKGL